MSDKKRKKVDLKKVFVRVMCLFLAALMVGGVLYALFTSFSFGSHAAESDKYIKIGLYYGTGTTRPAQSTFKLTSSSGFRYGLVDSNYKFQSSKTTSDSSIVVTVSSNTSNIVVKNSNGNVIYDAGGKLYIAPISSNFISIANSYSYSGIFEFTRTSSNIQLINIIELEEYVTGVIPNEIGSSYPVNAIEAFAIAVRSYTLTTLGKHSSYGFDLCWTSCCQVYRGRYNVTTKIENAVKNTKGLVMTNNGKIVQAYYSASQGGVSCSSYNVWGSNYSYLKAVATPWEKYEGTTHGTWTIEYTPSELLAQLRSKGYTTLKTDIAKVEITQFAENSSYAYNVKVTDTQGNSLVLPRADKIRGGLGVYSSNFVCGKAGEKVSRTYYAVSSDSTSESTISVQTSSGIRTTSSKNISIINKDSVFSNYNSQYLDVITPYGNQSISTTGSQYNTELEKMLYGTKIAKTEVVTLQGKSGNFVFEGKGWGHGVGLSQIGMKDLGNLGATSKQILTAYLPGISIVKYTDVK